MSVFEIPQFFTHAKNFTLGSTPLSFKFESSSDSTPSNKMQHANSPSNETQEASGYFFMYYTQLYLIIHNYMQLYTIVQIYVIIVYNNVLIIV